MINHIEQNPNDSLAAVHNLRNEMAEGFIQTGQLLSHIKRTKLYRFAGYETFKSYLEHEHNMKSALANKLIRIHEIYVEELDADEYTLKAIGLDRLVMMAPLLDKADWQQRDELLKIAENTPISELSDILKEMKEPGKTTDLKKVLIDQFKEQMCNLFNTSWSEVVFKLALFFTTPTKTDPIYLQALKKDVIHLQRQFEETVTDLTDGAEGHIGAPTSRLATGAEEHIGTPTSRLASDAEGASQPSNPSQPSKPQKDVNHGK